MCSSKTALLLQKKSICSFGKGIFQESAHFSQILILFRNVHFFRKSVMPIKFPPAILGPEMAAPILWAPGIFWFFLLENPHAHKIPPFRRGCWGFLEGGGVEVPILFLWPWGFFRFFSERKQHQHSLFGPNFLRAFLTPKPGCPGLKSEGEKSHNFPIFSYFGPEARNLFCSRPTGLQL